MHPKTKRNPNGAGRPKGPPGTTTTQGDRRNITVSRVEADALNVFREKLSAHIGVELTMSQCLRWLLNNAEKALGGPPLKKSSSGLGAAWRNLRKRRRNAPGPRL